MKKSISLAHGVLYHENTTVGPRHDPYSRDTFTMLDKKGKLTWELVACALAGDIFKTAKGFKIEYHCNGNKEDGNAFDAYVEKHTGFPASFWQHKIWEYKERAALAKMGPELYYQVQEILEADAVMLRNCY